MLLATSRYVSPLVRETDLIPVGITRGRPRFRLPYAYEMYQDIAPTWPMLRARLGKEEFAKRYFEQLDDIGAGEIDAAFTEVCAGAPGLVLLCYEDLRKEWCHRRIFSDWWKEETGQLVPELGDAQPALWP